MATACNNDSRPSSNIAATIDKHIRKESRAYGLYGYPYTYCDEYYFFCDYADDDNYC